MHYALITYLTQQYSRLVRFFLNLYAIAPTLLHNTLLKLYGKKETTLFLFAYLQDCVLPLNSMLLYNNYAECTMAYRFYIFLSIITFIFRTLCSPSVSLDHTENSNLRNITQSI